jgi:hypothetical protein
MAHGNTSDIESEAFGCGQSDGRQQYPLQDPAR